MKGLITEIQKKNKLYYQVEKPKKLVQFAKTQIQLSKDRLEKAQNVLPDLEGLFSLNPNKPIVRFFEGVDGVKDVYMDHISVDESYEMLGISNTEKLTNFLSKKFLRDYVTKKDKLGIVTRGILPDTPKDRTYKNNVYKTVSKKNQPKIRFIPTELFPYKGEITIYGDNRVSFINFHENRLVGVIIEDVIIHNMMRTVFELAWNGKDIQE